MKDVISAYHVENNIVRDLKEKECGDVGCNHLAWVKNT
jgi:hypothetical protein